MNYGQIKQNLISLGFAEESDYEEFEALGYTFSAINQAISQINAQFPYVDIYEFEIDDTDDGTYVVDMADRNGFLELAKDSPVLIERDGKNVFKPFGDYILKMDRVLNIDADKNKGVFRIYYNRACTMVSPTTDNSFVPELPLKVHHLIPLLTAYYLWLDDDVAKATQYYNMYETELAMILQKENMPRMRVLTEWGSEPNGFFARGVNNEIARGGI